MLAQRAAALGTSKTTASRIRADQLKASGLRIANLAAGELDLLPPPALVQLVAEHATGDIHRYTPTAGVPEVREHVAEYVARTRRLPLQAANVVMTTGAKHGLFETLYCLTDSGDDVLIPIPAWGTFVKQVEILGAHAVPVETDPQLFFPDVGTLERMRTARTRAVVINSPHNPTGTVYPDDLMLEIAQWAKRCGIVLVMDESYIDLYYTRQRPAHVCGLDPGVSDSVVTVGSFSKALAVTGWRSGFIHGPDKIVKAVTALQSHIASNPTSVCQRALEKLPVDEIERFTQRVRDILGVRRDLVMSTLRPVGMLDFRLPMGAFYFYINAQRYLAEHSISIDTLAERLLEHGVSVTSGSAFESDTHFRISYAVEDEELRAGLNAIASALKN